MVQHDLYRTTNIDLPAVELLNMTLGLYWKIWRKKKHKNFSIPNFPKCGFVCTHFVECEPANQYLTEINSFLFRLVSWFVPDEGPSKPDLKLFLWSFHKVRTLSAKNKTISRNWRQSNWTTTSFRAESLLYWRFYEAIGIL
jgi:hypothetical protein